MILFIIGALFVLIALAILIFSDDAKRTAIIPAVVAVIFIGISCVSYVPTGYTGIVTTFGKVEDGTKDAGVVFKAPWQSIVKMDNRVQEKLQELVAMLAETHIGEQEEPEQTFDDLNAEKDSEQQE